MAPAVDNISIQEESKRVRTHPSSGSVTRPAQPTMETIHDRDRPSWPANGITAEASLRRISALEGGNEDEKLMAMFARHVIRPERRHRPRQKWVSKRTLRDTFPEHFVNFGFLPTSTWASKSAEEFGLPNLFLRGVDEHTARLVPADDIVHLFAEADRGPDIDALSAGELDWLENRIDNYPVTSPAGLQSEEDSSSEDSDDGDDTVFSSFGRPRRVQGRTFESQSSYRLEDTGTYRQRHHVASSAIEMGQIEQVGDFPHVSDHTFAAIRSNDDERSVRPEHSSPTSTRLESGPSHETRLDPTMHTAKEALKFAPSITDARGHPPLDVKTTVVPLTPDDSQAAIRLLTPKISEILRDFPTSHEDPTFMLLLRDVVKATITGDTKSIEDSILELETHVVTTTVNKLSNNLNEMAVLARPILETLRRWHVQDPAINCGETRLTINRMSMARDSDGLRNMHAKMLIWEARSKQRSI
ncbi:hypothetical protein D6D01_00039 [Aureobasidium pullulans]|uniref:Uncharacterized protein n=1 Tax=Aureobasidium pullulans TaxID=5580 RepID=A0A4S9M376_AURPU|nr:hypothetical protein D6D01_00039 [Aureobasidium pullulans]